MYLMFVHVTSRSVTVQESHPRVYRRREGGGGVDQIVQLTHQTSLHTLCKHMSDDSSVVHTDYEH